MADREVVEILEEIRSRVRSQSLPRRNEALRARSGDGLRINPEITTLLESLAVHLETMERAQDRLPPVVSTRRGWLSRLELWFKGKAGRATRWYAWEQVNFNRAVAESLREITTALARLSQQPSRTEPSVSSAEDSAGLGQIESRLVALDEVSKKTELLDAKLATLRDTSYEHFSQLRGEQRLLLEQVLDEQRVHLRQLSLEIRETALAAEREARTLSTRLREIENSVAEIRQSNAEKSHVRAADSDRAV